MGKWRRRSLKVLVAEDDPDMGALYRRWLEDAGFGAVEVVPDGEAALRRAQAWQPDVAVLDVMMPRLNGWEVCKQIKSNPELAGVQVVVLTGIGPSLNEVSSPMVGADVHLDKPIDGATLVQTVEALATRRRA